MKEVVLTKNKTALVDNPDFDLVSQLKWHAAYSHGVWRAQAHITMDGVRTTLHMHRVILGIVNPLIQVDHRDGNGLNNQRHNLRLATASQNQANSRKRTGTSSRFKGVIFNKRSQCWYARIGGYKNRIFLGSFPTETQAAKAYDAAALEKFGEFARVNFP